MTPDKFLPLADALPEALLLLTSSGQIMAANRGAEEFLQICRDELTGKPVHDLVSNDDDKVDQLLRSWSRSKTPTPAPLTWKHGTSWKGNWRCHGYLLDPAAADTEGRIIIRCSKGKPQASEFLALNQEIKKQAQSLKLLKESRDQLTSEHEKVMVTLQSIGDAVITTDAEGGVEYLNPVAEALTGWTTEEARNKPLADVFNIINELTREQADNPVYRVLTEKRIVELANHTALIARDGTEYVIEDSAAPIRLTNGEILGVVLVFRDMTRDRLARRQLEYLAQHDTLTGLYNRHYFEQQLKHSIYTASRGKNSYALLYIDLDQFKTINDTAGHGAGDELLSEVAQIFAMRTRKGDVLARLGGDEFGLLLDDCDEAQALQVAGSFVQSLSGFSFDWEGLSYNITPSVGISLISKDTVTAAEALRQADIACYVAKQGGRNRSHLYKDSDEKIVSPVGEMGLINDIRAAINEDRFVLHYQPIFRTGSVRADIYEVLLRMVATDGTLISPGTFIPIAERYGLMPQIDSWVVSKVLELLASDYLNSPETCLSVNLSGSSIGSKDVLDQFRKNIRKHRKQAAKLIFEITETEAVGNIQRAGEFMRQLKQLGCRFALDDFGTGFSSFAYLKHLPVDFIKIDGTFVRDIVDDPTDQAMVRSIINIAHSLNKDAIAEFVENEDILELLKQFGVDYVQGFHTGKPKAEIQ